MANAVAWNYGYNWITGTKLQSRTITNSGNDMLDYTRVGMYLLGEGEMDGLVELWDSGLGRLQYQNEGDNPSAFHFHRGCDASYDAGAIGTDQGLDSFWQYLAPGLQPLFYHRWAYYAYFMKPLINNPPANPQQNDPNVWSDVNLIGLWRGIRCRMFDANGTMNGYAFTRNPAWHYVDVLCRRKLFPEYSIDPIAGADDLPYAVKARFDWAAIADSAANFAQPLADGQARFSGDYSFSQRTSLQANLTQILTCARAYQRERSGTFAIVADKPRASVFTFSRDNADSLVPNDEDVHSAPNDYVANFRDLQVPAAATIASISSPDHQSPLVTTELPHCFQTGDYIVIGNTGTRYDGNWVVESVPDGTSESTMTLVNKGSNYPTGIASGGLIGLRYSRFKTRAPEFKHRAHQLVRGAVGVGIPRQRNRVKVETDFSNSTWEQVARISAYQRGIALGPDVQPYVSPTKLSLHAPLFAEDAAGSGAVAIQLEPGDVVTIDDTLSTAYAGLYEVMPMTVTLTGSDGSTSAQRTPVAGGMDLTLRPYSDANYPDTSADTEPGWPDVPGLPGGNVTPTIFPLADGEAAFYTGSGANGDSFQMPDGYTTHNMLCWAAPQGYIEANGHLHFIRDCDAYPDRVLALLYDDSTMTWQGDVNYAVLCWRTNNSAALTTVNGITYVELTLAGGEKIVFGKGVVDGGNQVPTMPGYGINGTIPLAFPKSGADAGYATFGVGAWVNASGIVHNLYHDNGQAAWEGPASVMMCAVKNKLGTWRKSQDGWLYAPLPDARILALAGQTLTTALRTIQADPPTPVIIDQYVHPLANVASTTIQVMAGPNGYDITSHPAHGVKQCFVDDSLEVFCSFEDGEGNAWGGSTGIFALLCDTPSADPGGVPLPADATSWPGTGTTGPGGSGGGNTGTGTGSGGGGGVGGGGVGGGTTDPTGGGGRGFVEQ